MRSSSCEDEGEDDVRYTTHLNLKEGISNMKVSYIPDFGYSEQLNFSIDSQRNNVSGMIAL